MNFNLFILLAGFGLLIIGLILTFLAKKAHPFWLYMIFQFSAIVALTFSFIAFFSLLFPSYLYKHPRAAWNIGFFLALFLSVGIAFRLHRITEKETGEDDLSEQINTKNEGEPK